MKNLLLSLLLIVSVAKAQEDSLSNRFDTLFFRSGNALAVKIVIANSEQVRYRKATHLNGPMHVTLKTDIARIRHADGRMDTLSTPKEEAVVASAKKSDTYYEDRDMFLQGKNDARRYYRHPGGSIGTGITSLFLGPLGMIPAIICISHPPKVHNLGYPDPKLWENDQYRLGYRKTARRIKNGRVRLGFFIGALGFLAVGSVLASG